MFAFANIFEGVVSKSETLSVRVSSDDAAWIAALDVDGATTSSDKVRALISQARTQELSFRDYATCVTWVRALLGPAVTRLRSLEDNAGLHSELLSAVTEGLPPLVATILTATPSSNGSQEALSQIEGRLAQKAFAVFQSIMRLAVTAPHGLTNPDVFRDQLPAIMEMAEIIKGRKE